ncbi:MULTISPECIES: SRPBCC family protein [Streptomyces]|uniref:SRPBCC family protein n=1 Tax=Streptomyces desertarenae TaxID=2666184 RepID=A0ABW4PLJ5_9ACTN
MAWFESTVQCEIGAGADEVFAALADYAGTRGGLLPARCGGYEVHAGGDGAGTLVRWEAAGPPGGGRSFLLEVDEPMPGQLVERDRCSSLVTTWTVTPAAGAGTARVTVTAVWEEPRAGALLRAGGRRLARRLGRDHREVLGNLAARLAAPPPRRTAP